MNFDFFQDFIKSTKENDFIQSFIKELGESLENNLDTEEKNQLSLVQKTKNLTTTYRDQANIERGNILDKYAKETLDKGNMYYIYSKSSGKENTYNACIYEEGKNQGIIKIKEMELPKGAGVDSILRIENGKYTLDKQTTEKLYTDLTEMINRLLKEQEKTVETQRIEGNLYEVVEKSVDKVVLIDRTNYTGECIEEVNFSKEALNQAARGSIFQYINGEYQLYSK